jgi:hypothetical protein
MNLAPGQTLKCRHCTLVLRNVTKSPVEFRDGKCPQCHSPIAAGDIKHPIPQFQTLKLFPPHGMSFKNELGSEVSIRYESGRELELFTELQRQLQAWIAPIASERQNQQAGVAASGADFNSSVIHAARTAPKITIAEDGSIIMEEPDGPPPAAGA